LLEVLYIDNEAIWYGQGVAQMRQVEELWVFYHLAAAGRNFLLGSLKEIGQTLNKLLILVKTQQIRYFNYLEKEKKNSL
jgi:hypothetical protein